MSTVGALIDRMYRQILEPPDAQPASSRLSVLIDASTTTVVLALFDIPEDENLLRLGSILEIDQELMRVTGFDAATRTATVIRGYLGTTATQHAQDAQIKLSPPYPRVDAFNAVRDNVVGLYPDLWTVKTEVLGRVGGGVFPIEDPLAVEIVEANPDGSWGTVNLPSRIVDNHPSVDGRAIIVNGNPPVSTIWFRYRRRFAAPTSEADTLTTLGVESVWETMVMVGAAADLMAGRDVQASHTEWVQSVMEAENIRVGTRLSVAGGLAQYRDILMQRFRKEMRGEDSNRIRIHQREVYA